MTKIYNTPGIYINSSYYVKEVMGRITSGRLFTKITDIHLVMKDLCCKFGLLTLLVQNGAVNKFNSLCAKQEKIDNPIEVPDISVMRWDEKKECLAGLLTEIFSPSEIEIAVFMDLRTIYFYLKDNNSIPARPKKTYY